MMRKDIDRLILRSGKLHDRTIRLLIDWRIEGIWMKGWIVQKDAASAALLVSQGFAEYVPDGIPPPSSQLEWARALAKDPS